MLVFPTRNTHIGGLDKQRPQRELVCILVEYSFKDFRQNTTASLKVFLKLKKVIASICIVYSDHPKDDCFVKHTISVRSMSKKRSTAENFVVLNIAVVLYFLCNVKLLKELFQ